MCANLRPDRPRPRVGYAPVANAELFYREIGEGQPIIILHGGPEFDHNYLLPDMDRLSDSFRLIYYDQRGRGKSARNVNAADITISSEIEDLDQLRAHFQLPTVAILGHSWGGGLALEYALRHPERVSHLILLNSSPACHADFLLWREERRRNAAGDIIELKAMAERADFQAADPDAVTDYLRIHFRATLRQPEHLESVIQNLRASFTQEGMLKARAIDDRLMEETWLSSEYNLLPKLTQLDIPTVVIHGDYDFIPVECVAHIAEAIPGARLVLLPETGHFSYLENPNGVRRAITGFFQAAAR